MKFLLGIPYVNRPDLLRLAVASVRPFHARTVIIDNSEQGLFPADWPVEVLRPSVPLTFSQTMNLLQNLAFERGCEALLSMHNDAEAEAGTCERLLAIIEESFRTERRWGVIFTHYDTLAAFSMEMVAAVGPWDTTLPQYFADNDYYRRVRLLGFETIDTGLPVTHHHNASSTVKSDPWLGWINGVTYPLHGQYYAAKWGGGAGRETYASPFNGKLSELVVEGLRQSELYQRLAASYDSVEGNLLERAEERTHAAQIEAIRYLLRLARPRRILETGTHKSLFGYVLSQMVESVMLYTFDGDERCLPGVSLLNSAQRRVSAVFTLGDTKETLEKFAEPDIGLAWIDGGHDEPTAFSDLCSAMRLEVPLIAVDDARTMPEVASAIERALESRPDYRRFFNPFYEHDGRGIVFLRRR